MIFGIGVDIAKISRFEKWTKNPGILKRFFNENEIPSSKSTFAFCEHLAVRFAAKEAFSKAIGTGLCGFNLKDVYIKNDSNGRPEMFFCKSAEKLLKTVCGDCKVFVSLSHEKEYAIAFVLIEKI